MPIIKPISTLRNQARSIATFCHRHDEPVYLTTNGSGDLAVMSIEHYERLKAQADLLEQLGLGGRLTAGEVVFYKETGCAKCKQYGYIGRTGIYELLLPNERIRDLITKKSSAAVITEEAVRSGMRTLRDAGIEKVLQGVTSVSEILRVTEEI